MSRPCPDNLLEKLRNVTANLCEGKPKLENLTWKDKGPTVLFENSCSLNHGGLLVTGCIVSGWGPLPIQLDA
jgi:hypothetical protein